MSLSQDTKEMLELAQGYMIFQRCAGGRIVVKGYCCTWCDSPDPKGKCRKPRRGKKPEPPQ